MPTPHNLPKISIITPSFRQPQFIERTINSILGQNYPNLEYLIYDGGSADGTVDIIKKYQDKIAFWVSEKDQGQSDAINKGLARATGEILGWINSDDTLAPGALHAIGNYYARHPEAEFLYGNTNLIDADDRILRRLIAIRTNAHELIRFNRNLFSQPGTTWRRRLQDKIGLLDASLHYTMDGDFFIRAAQATALHMIPRHLANLRIHGESKSSAMRTKFEAEHQILNSRYGIEYRTGFPRAFFNVRRRLRIVLRPANWPRMLGR